MAYQKHIWVSKEVIKREYLQNMEDGIYNEEQRALQAEGALEDLVADETERAQRAESGLQNYVDQRISTVYRPKGSIMFADLPLPSVNTLGWVYDVTDAFTTNEYFVGGAGKKYPANTNIGVNDVGTEDDPVYKWDVLPGFINTEAYDNAIIDFSYGASAGIGYMNIRRVKSSETVGCDPIPVACGGTGAFNAAAARANLGILNCNATEDGTQDSLVTTGDKYNWNEALSSFEFIEQSDIQRSYLRWTGAGSDSIHYVGGIRPINPIPVGCGGTGAKNASNARQNLGIGNVGTLNYASDTTKYLRNDGTWQVPPNTTYGVVSKSANGLCPILPNETATTKYLRQDGTWAAPSGTTYSAGAGLVLSSTTFKVKLVTESKFSLSAWLTGGDISQNRLYAVQLDKDGCLCTYVDWKNTTYTANNGVGLSGTTFYNSGVRSIATGTANGTISVNTNGTAADVAVKGVANALTNISFGVKTQGTLSYGVITKTTLSGVSEETFTMPVECGGTGQTSLSLFRANLYPKLCVKTFNTSASTTKIKIAINSNKAWMLCFVVTLYQGYRATRVMISGYQYGNNYWYSPKATLLGDSDGGTINVYFGYTSAKNLWVGFDGGNYTGVAISDVTNGYEEITNYESLFTITNVSSLSTIQTTVAALKPDAGTVNGVKIAKSGSSYGYYNGSTFVAFKSQADIDSAVAAAKVGTATADKVLAGWTFTNSSTSGLSGSMANNSAWSKTLTAANTSYSGGAGYYPSVSASVAAGVAKIGSTVKTWSNGGTVALSYGQTLSIGAGVYYAGSITAPTPSGTLTLTKAQANTTVSCSGYANVNCTNPWKRGVEEGVQGELWVATASSDAISKKVFTFGIGAGGTITLANTNTYSGTENANDYVRILTTDDASLVDYKVVSQLKGKTVTYTVPSGKTATGILMYTYASNAYKAVGTYITVTYP